MLKIRNDEARVPDDNYPLESIIVCHPRDVGSSGAIPKSHPDQLNTVLITLSAGAFGIRRLFSDPISAIALGSGKLFQGGREIYRFTARAPFRDLNLEDLFSRRIVGIPKTPDRGFPREPLRNPPRAAAAHLGRESSRNFRVNPAEEMAPWNRPLCAASAKRDREIIKTESIGSIRGLSFP